MTIVDRNALWQAWPEGYLPMNGVTTIGGWITSVDIEDGPYWHAHDTWFNPQKDLFERVREMGQLLPAVDPAETATWACLLLDLASDIFPNEPVETWRRGLTWSRFGHGWLLGLSPYDRVASRVAVFSERYRNKADRDPTPLFLCSGVDTDDPALALVIARILVRTERST